MRIRKAAIMLAREGNTLCNLCGAGPRSKQYFRRRGLVEFSSTILSLERLSGLPVTMAHAISVQDLLQVVACVRTFDFGDRFRRSKTHKISSARATFRTKIDNPISRLDNF